LEEQTPRGQPLRCRDENNAPEGGRPSGKIAGMPPSEVKQQYEMLEDRGIAEVSPQVDWVRGFVLNRRLGAKGKEKGPGSPGTFRLLENRVAGFQNLALTFFTQAHWRK